MAKKQKANVKETVITASIKAAIGTGHELFQRNFDANLAGVRTTATRMSETLCAILETEGGHEEAQAAANTYKEDADKMYDKYKDDEDSPELAAARMCNQWASKMNRVIRGTFEAFKYKDEKGKEQEWKPLGVEKAVAILKGKGTLHEKLSKFGSSGEGPKKGKADTMQQVRNVLSGKVEVIRDIPTLATMLSAVPTRGAKALKDRALESATVASLTASIKVCPAKYLGSVVETTISRMIADPDFHDMGLSFADAWKRFANESSKAIDNARKPAKSKGAGVAAPLAHPVEAK